MNEAKTIAVNKYGNSIKFSTGKSVWNYMFTIALKRGYWVGDATRHTYHGMNREKALAGFDV